MDGVGMHELVEDRRDVVTGERLQPAQHLEGDDAEGEDIGAAVEVLAHRLLGRHVARRPHHDAGMSDVGIHHLRDPEVGDLHFLTGEDDDVGGLDVPVHDAFGVGVVDGARDLRNEANHHLGLQPLFLEHFGHRLTFDILHRQPGHLAFVPDVVQRDDVGMGQATRASRLDVEPLQKRPVVRTVRRHVEAQRLQRDLTLDDGIEGQVDRTHRAEPDGRFDLVTTDLVWNVAVCHGQRLSFDWIRAPPDAVATLDERVRQTLGCALRHCLRLR